MVSCYPIGQHRFRPFQTYAPNWIMLHLAILPDRCSVRQVHGHFLSFGWGNTDPENNDGLQSHSLVKSRAGPRPSSIFSSSWCSVHFCPLSYSPALPQDLHPVSIFGQLSPQFILCNPQLPTRPETWVRQTLQESLESIRMVRPLYVHTPSCRFVGSWMVISGGTLEAI